MPIYAKDKRKLIGSITHLRELTLMHLAFYQQGLKFRLSLLYLVSLDLQIENE